MLLGARRALHSRALLDWKDVTQKVPWGVLFLVGGGFALAEASSDDWTGFAGWCANQLEILETLPKWTICLLVSIISSCLTEIASNTELKRNPFN